MTTPDAAATTLVTDVHPAAAGVIAPTGEQGHFRRLNPENIALSADARERARLAALATRRANLARLRSDFPASTEAEWSDLAARFGVKLPPYGVPVTNGGIRRFLGKVGVSVDESLAWDGDRTLSGFGRRNPTWPLKSLAGLILEALDSGHLAAIAPPGVL